MQINQTAGSFWCLFYVFISGNYLKRPPVGETSCKIDFRCAGKTQRVDNSVGIGMCRTSTDTKGLQIIGKALINSAVPVENFSYTDPRR